MNIDHFTIMLFGLFTKLMLGVLFLDLLAQRQERRRLGSGGGARRSCSAASPPGASCCAASAATFFGSGIGVATLIAAFGCCWQGARAFDKRRPILLPVLLAAALWLAASLVPGFLDNVAARVVLSSLLLAPVMAMSAVEFWRGRQEPLQSRWPVIVLFSTLRCFSPAGFRWSICCRFRSVRSRSQPGWMVAFNLIVFFHALMLTVLIVAMSKERLELDQRMKAQTDPLTGALNRRAFMARGARLVQRHQHETAPLCLLFLDLDHFKSLNDRFGHSGGDDVLMTFVAVVHENIRPTDFLFRIGGEEFCCLLPHTRTDQAHTVAERIRHSSSSPPSTSPARR